MTWFLRTVSLLLALTLAACGGGTDRTKAQVRLVNASTYEQLDLRVHDERRQSSVAYGASADYVEIDPDKADTQITQAGSSTALQSFNASVSARKHYTWLAYGPQGALKQVQLDEDQSQPDNNKALLRVVNGAPDAGNLDIYLTATDDAFSSAVPVQSAAAYGSLGSFLTLDSRSWRLRVTAAGSKTDVRLDIASLQLGNRQIATLVITPGVLTQNTPAGPLVGALLITQQGAISRLDNTQARVRAVAGVANGAVVSVSIGNAPALLSNIASTAVGNYALVPAGTQALSVTVAGTALTTSNETLVPGRDYTVLVYGTPAAPQAVLRSDDNRVPSDSTTANIRLVNGVSGLAAPATLTVDATPIGSGVAAGQASVYNAVTATTTADIVVSSPGAATALYSEVDRTLLAGATYTVFVLGGAGDPPRGVLRRDR